MTKLKGKNSPKCRKIFDRVQHVLMILKITNFSKLGIKGNFLNLIKDICQKHTANVILIKPGTEGMSAITIPHSTEVLPHEMPTTRKCKEHTQTF